MIKPLLTPHPMLHTQDTHRGFATCEPIFCDRCPDLALAMVDGVPLCIACLMASIENIMSPKGEIEVTIEPLSIHRDG